MGRHADGLAAHGARDLVPADTMTAPVREHKEDLQAPADVLIAAGAVIAPAATGVEADDI
ncbi:MULTISPECIES: hypothetical protein [unclassified Streptomyces]|uniref:hypothetical protein n=1 Tax=unclassified Streptomyces TaxID=2593676 RepID=UPI00093C4535|nr:hypothetical protein [Streptomyces sp. TSRI0281]OKI32136.1 hypothetical protein A6A29_21555 [Streptomyces sp. TSRI0281]